MSRTWRNKKTVFRGLKVRDGDKDRAYDRHGICYFFANEDEKIAHEHCYHDKFETFFSKEGKIVFIIYFTKRPRRRYVSKENKSYRKAERKSIRRKVKMMLHNGNWEKIPIEKKSSGWNSW